MFKWLKRWWKEYIIREEPYTTWTSNDHREWSITIQQPKESRMKVSTFSEKVALKENGKKEVDIAQIKEILKVTNKLLNGVLYREIRKLK